MTTATVLSGPERRRRWTRAEKALIVEESLCGGSVAEVARRHDVHANLLHAWRRQARTGTLVGGRDAQMMPAGDFAPVAIASDGSVAGATRSDAEADGAVIELVLRNGRVLRLPAGVAPARVAALADVLVGSGR
jgi:transposase